MTDKNSWFMLSAVGGEIVEAREGYARGVLPLSETVMQPTQVFHAGAIVTLADEVASAAIHGSLDFEEGWQEKKPFPYSVQLSVNLLTNDPVGPLTAESRVIKKGRMTVVDTEVKTHRGDVAAVMRSTHLMVDLKTRGPQKRA